LAVLSPRFPGLVVGARLGSPLVLGVGKDESLLASDPSALVGHTEKVVYLSDRQLCVLTPDEWKVLNADCAPAEARVHALDWDPGDCDKGAFEHFMLKEIYEQPEVLQRAMAGRFDEAEATAHFGGLNVNAKQLREVDRIILTACGTSYHAALLGEYLI